MKPIRPLYHSRKKAVTTNQLWSYALLFLVLVIFMATVGLRILINTALFVSDAVNKNRTDDRTATGQLLEDPTVEALPVATNSAELAISGTIPKAGSVTFYVNNNDQKKLLLTDETFDTTVHLFPGDNTIYIELEDGDTGKTYQSEKQSISFVSEKPNLEITSPTDGTKVTSDSVDIVGSTDQGNSIRINGRPGIIGGGGSFTIPYLLKDGDNEITVTVMNAAGSVETAVLHVTKEGL